MEKSKVCPVCGMQLVGRKNYCMGCGENVDLGEEDGSLASRGASANLYKNGTPYKNNREFQKRFQAAINKRERRMKKNVFAAGGLASVLLITFASIVGIVSGILALKWYFAPKEVTVVFWKDQKVVDVANVTRIDPPKEQGFLIVPDPSEKKTQEEEEDPMEVLLKKSGKRAADPEMEKFRGIRTLQALGDKVLEWEETQTWDVKGLDANSVAYVVNNLYYQYDEFRDKVFIDFELTQTEDEVIIYVACHHLDLEENLLELARMGVITSEETVTHGKERYLSLIKVKNIFFEENWLEEGMAPKTTVIYAN